MTAMIGFEQIASPAAAGKQRTQEQAKPFAEACAERVEIAARGGARQRRQRDRAERHAEHADRQVHETKRDAQPRYRPVAELGSEVGVDDDVDLDGRDAERGGAHQSHHLDDARVAKAGDGR